MSQTKNLAKKFLVETLESRQLLATLPVTTLANFQSNPPGEPDTFIFQSNGDLWGSFLDKGVIIRMKKGTRNVEIMAKQSANSLVFDNDGNLFGTDAGGQYGRGLVFELPKGSNTIVSLASFGGGDGTDPDNIAIDADGNLYGSTLSGGTNFVGTIWKLAKGANKIETLSSMTIATATPWTMSMDSNGDFYGTAEGPTVSDVDVVYKLKKGSHTTQVVANFLPENGTFPRTFIPDGTGTFYGTALEGGSKNEGTIYKYVRGENTVSTLANFDSSIDGNKYSGVFTLLLDKSGNLFGAAFTGGLGFGSVFELAKGSSTPTTIAKFDSFGLAEGLAIDAAGNLFGGVRYTQPHLTCGIYTIAAGTSAIDPIYSFIDDGINPFMLATDSAGNIYGMTQETGHQPLGGTIFKLRPGSNDVEAIYTFPEYANNYFELDPGAQNLVVDPASGDIFGIYFSSRPYLFKLPKGSNEAQKLFTFDSQIPVPSGLTLDRQGNLFARTATGGANNGGLIFKVSRGTATPIKIADLPPPGQFAQYNQFPESPLIIDAEGNIFGSIGYGGDSDAGSIFELAAGSSIVTTLASFDYTHGHTPYRLTIDASGNIFGVAIRGSSHNGGILFELPKGSDQVDYLVRFVPPNVDGPYPTNLVIDAKGTLWGAVPNAGPNDTGTIFKFTKGDAAITYLADVPRAQQVIFDTRGNLLGVSAGNYGPDFGSIFRVEMPAASGSIKGSVFNDLNSNGVKDGAEKSIANWPIFMDFNNNRTLDADEPSTMTDAAGNFTFAGVQNGTYYIKSLVPAGYRKTLPGSGTSGYVATINNGSAVADLSFGITSNIRLAGKVFNDANSNGVQDAGELPMAGVTVNIISNGQTIASRSTDANGDWKVQGLSQGAGQAVVVLPAGYVAINPASGKYIGAMTAGQQFNYFNFALHKTSPVPATAFSAGPGILRSADTRLEFFDA